MLRPQFLIIFGVLVVLLIVFNTVRESAANTVDPHGRDSFGTRYFGWRGFYDTLEKLKIPVRRSLVPPPLSLNQSSAIFIFWESAPAEIEREPEYLQTVREWVVNGGTVVIAPPRYNGAQRFVSGRRGNPLFDFFFDHSISTLLFDTAAVEIRRPVPPPDPRERTFSEDVDYYERAVADMRDMREYRVRGIGRFRALAQNAKSVFLPRRLQILRSEIKPRSALTVNWQNRAGTAIAMEFPLGHGSVIVCSEPALIYNLYLSQPNNAALAAKLLGITEQSPVIFDEFYHGHRGVKKVYQLFLTSPLREIVGTALLFTVLAIWRYGIRFGSPLVDAPIIRRTILEYLTALARLFHRGATRRYVVQEVFSGIIWNLQRHLHCPVRRENYFALAQILRKRAPVAADNFLMAAQHCEQLLAVNSADERKWLMALENLTAAITLAMETTAAGRKKNAH